MSNTILIKRSSTAGAVPAALAAGELAINTADKKLFFKSSVGAIVSFSMTVADTATAIDAKQDKDATLTALAGLTTAADQIPYSTGSDAFAMTAFTSFARTLAAKADAASFLSAIGAPSASGANASGTWGISIAGNAATATNATNVANPKFSSDTINIDDITTRLNSGIYQVSDPTVAKGWPSGVSSWAHLLSMTHSNPSNYYSAQIAASFFANDWWIRSTNGSGTTGWNKLITDGNVANYAPSLTGNGASGTWSISISGNASTVAGTTPGTTGKAVLAAADPAMARGYIMAAASGANGDITSLSGLTTALSVGQGGTGATTAAGARAGLGAAASGANGDITSLTGLTTALSIAQGGTGATTAAAARAAFGLTIGASPGNIVALDASGKIPALDGSQITGVATDVKAWVNFDGSLSGTITPRASKNVSSVTKNGTGDYTINFASALADANYAAIGSVWRGYADTNADFTFPLSGVYSATACRVNIRNSNTFGLTDGYMVNVAFFR